MKKRLFAGLLTAMMVASMMVTSAFAIAPEAVTGQDLHTVTVEAQLVPLASTSTMSKSLKIGLALDAGASGWSTVYEIRFSTVGIPSDAVVQNIKIVPGTATANESAPKLQGLVVASQMKITAPNLKSTTMAIAKTMETTALNNAPVKGTWTLQMYGTNLTRPIGDWTDSIRFGSLHYNNCNVTVTYASPATK
jgi:hypothetical protein